MVMLYHKYFSSTNWLSSYSSPANGKHQLIEFRKSYNQCGTSDSVTPTMHTVYHLKTIQIPVVEDNLYVFVLTNAETGEVLYVDFLTLIVTYLISNLPKCKKLYLLIS